MSRGTQALISLSAARHNLSIVRSLAPNSKVWAVVKANAYGHGVEAIANILAPSADGFAVATLSEAIELRECGLTQPILLLEGITKAEHIALVIQHDFQTVIHCQEQLDFLSELNPTDRIKIWVKFDSGLHRIGFAKEALADVYDAIERNLQVELVGQMTHLACADDENDPFTYEQIANFDAAVSEQGIQSISNSAAIVQHPKAHRDWVRPGIMLYGSTPVAGKSAKAIGLKPVMSLQTPIIALKTVKVGDSVGYGLRWTAKKDSRIATLAIGYADGYPRHAPDGTPFFINGVRVPLAGKVSMDMITIDVTDAGECQVGDMVECWGENLPVDDVAKSVDTIGYELLTRVSSRVQLSVID